LFAIQSHFVAHCFVTAALRSIVHSSYSSEAVIRLDLINEITLTNNLWHRALTCKLLRLLSDRHMVRLIMDLVGNRSFPLPIGNNKGSRLRRLKNNVPHGSILSPLYFNIYISDLSITVSRVYAHSGDLAIMHTDGDWQAVEGVLSKNMATIGNTSRPGS